MPQAIYLIASYTRDVITRTGKPNTGFKFLRRTLWSFNSAVQWLHFIGPYYERFGFEQPPIDMVVKLAKRKHLTVAEVVRRLKNHYLYIAECFSLETVRRLLREEPIAVCTLRGKTGQNYTIHLQHAVKFQQEGELTFSLYHHESMHYLGHLTFSIARLENGAPLVWISCLQGDHNTGAKERIVKATRDLHGLRPKTILLESTYILADVVHAAELRAIANHNHPFAGSKKKVVLADYDSFWEEVGGTRIQHDNFLLPATIKRRVLEEVPPRKRKDWLKRQEYINRMQTDIRNVLSSFWVASATIPIQKTL